MIFKKSKIPTALLMSLPCLAYAHEQPVSLTEKNNFNFMLGLNYQMTHSPKKTQRDRDYEDAVASEQAIAAVVPNYKPKNLVNPRKNPQEIERLQFTAGIGYKSIYGLIQYQAYDQEIRVGGMYEFNRFTVGALIPVSRSHDAYRGDVSFEDLQYLAGFKVKDNIAVNAQFAFKKGESNTDWVSVSSASIGVSYFFHNIL